MTNGSEANELARVRQNTPLHVACAQGHLHVIRYLVDEAGVEVNPVDRFGRTPLFEARLCSNSAAVLEFLTQHGAQMPEKGGSAVHLLLGNVLVPLFLLFL